MFLYFDILKLSQTYITCIHMHLYIIYNIYNICNIYVYMFTYMHKCIYIYVYIYIATFEFKNCYGTIFHNRLKQASPMTKSDIADFITKT